MPDLGTRNLGLALGSPLVATAGPLSEDLEQIRRMEAAGAAAAVLHSLFEEQITLESHSLDHHLSQGSESYAEALSFFSDMPQYRLGPEAYLEHVRRAEPARETVSCEMGRPPPIISVDARATTPMRHGGARA